MMRTVWFWFVLVFVAESAAGQIAQTLVFNEIAFEEPSIKDEDGDGGSGWLEVMNTSDHDIHTSGLQIVLNRSLTWQFPALNIPPSQHVLVWLSGKNKSLDSTNVHSSLTVTNKSGNHFELFQNNKLLDSVTIRTKMQWREAYARYPDGTGNWYLVDSRTPRRPNELFGLWKKISSTAPFEPRDAALNAALYYKDRFWILTGWTGDSKNPSRQIWSSPDLASWQLTLESGPYKAGANFIVFKNKMWAFDGDAYCSDDGIAWTKVASNLPFTQNNRIVLFHDKLIVVAGKTVFTSSDGKEWHVLTAEAPWPDRDLPGLVAYKDALWIFGGSKYHPKENPPLNDVWKSLDGVTWQRIIDHAPWPGRTWFGHAVFDDKMWIFGGWDYYLEDDVNDVWYTEDGFDWKELRSSTIWTDRHAPYHWVTDDALWLSSGFNTAWYGLYNDAWKLEKGALAKRDTFYLKRNEVITRAASWSSSEDGTGFPPTTFESDNQVFMIHGKADVTINEDWNVTGENSKTVLGNGRDSIAMTIPAGLHVNGTVVLDSLATLELQSDRSPTIVESQFSSVVKVNVEGPVDLDAIELANLVIDHGEVQVTRPITIKESVAIGDGHLLNTEDLHFLKNSSLTYSSINGVIHRYAIYSDHPSVVNVNCDCQVELHTDAAVDTLILNRGHVRLSGHELFASALDHRSDTAFIITDRHSLLTIGVPRDTARFPIGLSSSFNPLYVTNAAVQYLSARVFEATSNEISCADHAVQLIWELFSPAELSSARVTMQWDSLAQGPLFERKNALVSLLHDARQDHLEIKDDNNNASPTLSVDMALPYASAFVVHNKVICTETLDVSTFDQLHQTIPERVSVFPNPTHGRLSVVANEENLEIEKVVLMDTAGRGVFARPANSNESIDLTEIPKGLYILQIETSGGVFVEKIVID
jgi:hypothetical protein